MQQRLDPLRRGGFGPMTRDRTAGWLSSTFVLALSVGILLAPLAGGSAPRPVAGSPATDSPATDWAFAGAQVVNQSTGQASATFSESGAFDFADLLSETSTGPYSAYVVAERGMTAQFAYRLCAPTCAAPSYEVSGSVTGHEWTVEFLNLSLRASTAQGLDAVGITNLSVDGAASFAGTTLVTGSSASPASEVVSGSAQEGFTLAFSPALALFPLSTDTAGWSSAASVLATGSWSSALSIVYAGLPTPDARTNAHQNLSAASVSLTGTLGDAFALATGEEVVPQTVEASGGSGLLDGLFWSPAGASLFPPGAAGPGSSFLAEVPTTVDLDPAVASHLGLAGASVLIAPRLGVPTQSVAAPAGANLSSLAPAGWLVQSQPETPAAAAAFFANAGVRAASPAPIAAPSAAAPVGSWALVVGLGALIGLAAAVGTRWMPDAWTGGPGIASRLPRRPLAAAPGPVAPAVTPLPRLPESAAPSREPFDDLL